MQAGLTIGTVQVPEGSTTINFAFRRGGIIYVVGKGAVYRIEIDEEIVWEGMMREGRSRYCLYLVAKYLFK